MALRESAFPSVCVSGLHAVSWALVFPSFWFLDRLIANVKSTTREREARRDQECYYRPLQVLFGSLLFLVLFLIWAPLGLLGFLLWAPLQAARRPFVYQQGAPRLSVCEERNASWRSEGRLSLSFASANLCLLPDSLARFNNLQDTQWRAATIGGSIVQAASRADIQILVQAPSPSPDSSPSSCSGLLAHNAPGGGGAGHASYGATVTQATPIATPTSPQPANEVTPDTQPANEVTPDTQPANEETPDTQPANDVRAEAQEAPQPANEDAAAAPFPHGGGRNSVAPQPPHHPSSPVANSNPVVGVGGEGMVSLDLEGACHSAGEAPPVSLSSMFPVGLDFLCLQEVFDRRAARRMCSALAPLYGHVLYDVGGYACQPPGSCSAFKFFNSGLLLASRHPLLAAEYNCFPNARGEDALAAKGLLCTKVLLSLPEQGEQRIVGYLNCTHLHAPEGDGAIRYEQLNMVCEWISEFQSKHSEEGETVAFDILCGDLNFDNTSPDDDLEQSHGVFDRYCDPCRAGPGQEKPGVIGTLLEQPSLYDEEVNTPDNLQRALEDEALRCVYLSPPLAKGGKPLPQHGGIGRRIDYLMYRNTATHTEVEEVSYITQLAAMTDHLPVGLRLNITLPT
ncbi:sphingomyelin phosphodiesterase 5 [Engraulis encrasicolus]|uniref:sphingomyelin phosphodiesterase 5 n=1 Tax=Engraulis encrasicolus TaxID=184585 RepID=UPI002FD0E8DD